jgi:hypothetical protein
MIGPFAAGKAESGGANDASDSSHQRHHITFLFEHHYVSLQLQNRCAAWRM